MRDVVDVVVVAYRNEDVLRRCLGSVQGLDAVATVTVVDNGDGACAALAESLGARTVRLPHNPGFGAGQNAGARLGRAPFLLMLNPDAEIKAEAIVRGVQVLEARPSAAAVQGVITQSASGDTERSQGVLPGPVHLLGRAFGLRRLLTTRVGRHLGALVPVTRDHVERRPSGVCRVQYLAATAMLVRRTAFEAVGGFDERFFLYGEDVDLCQRLGQSGWDLLACDIGWAVHDNAGSASSTWDRELTWWQGTMLYAARWLEGWAWLTALSAAFVAAARLVVTRPGAIGPVTGAVFLEPRRQHRWARSHGTIRSHR